MSSVERALLVLSGRVEPYEESVFTDFDAALGHALAERVTQGVALSGKQRRTAHRMMRKYVGQLNEAGIDWATIEVPTTAEPPTDAVMPVRSGDKPRASVESDRIVVRSPYELKDVCKSIHSARWSPRVPPRGAWTYPASPTSALNIVEAFQRFDLECDDSVMALVAAARQQQAAAVHKDATDLPPIPGEQLPSWLHQRQAFWFARELDAVLLAMDMGTGKSKVAIDLVRENGARRVLILCPSKVLGVWPKQFRIHGPEGRFHVTNGTDHRGEPLSVADRVAVFDNVLHECDCGLTHVVVANYEITAYEPFKSWALDQVWDYAVLDESHRVRAPQGVWSKWCSKLRDRSARRLCLTGTPLGQSPLDAFAQYRFLDQAIFGTSYTSFEHRYAVKGGYQGYEVLGMRTSSSLTDGRPNPYYSPDLEQEFDRKFFSVAFEVSSDVLDLPDASDITRTFDLPASARKVYRELDDELYADLQAWDAGEVTTPNVLVKMLRLQQLTSGALSTDDSERPVDIHTGKQDLLEDVLSDLDPHEPIVVFCRFLWDLDAVQRVAEKLKRPYYELSGRRGDALTQDSTLAPDAGVVGVQIQAGGVGVDFTKARYAIYFSLGFSLIDYKQSRKRLDRPGQERPVIFIHLVANSTIDEVVYESLARNEASVEQVMKRQLGVRS